MTYVPHWERLSEARRRVMEAGVSKDKAQADICRAIGDRAIKFQGKLASHASKPLTAADVLEGTAFEIAPELKPEDLDWEKSRPLKPWPVRHGSFRVAGYWHLERIELFRTDVTKELCAIGKQGEPIRRASNETNTKSRRRPALERARSTINALYGGHVPDQAIEPNVSLCRAVGKKLKADGLPSVSDDTILRAAGRRRK